MRHGNCDIGTQECGRGEAAVTAERRLRTPALAASIAAAAVGFAGCAGMQPNAALEDARSTVASAERNPDVVEHAAVELQRARDALSRADAVYEAEGNSEAARLEHEAYLAMRFAEIAMSEAERARYVEEIENSEAERNRVLLEVRETEARQAEQQADQAAQVARRESREADRAQAVARQRTEQAIALQQRLTALEAERTDRGLVLTLDDVLFDTDRAELKPAANGTMDRLADFLREYEGRVVRVEGYTDSTGPTEYNAALSMRRANAVRDALLDRGIDGQRVETRGLGESSPAATNDTAAGRQQNRRVEIVISDDQGRFQTEAVTRSGDSPG